MLTFGAVGYILRRARFPLAPIIIGMILGPVLENNFRRALIISHDGLMIFVERPISAVIIAIDIALLIAIFVSTVRLSRREPNEAKVTG